MPSSETQSRRPSVARDLHPACFALVMATGIVSVAAQLRGYAHIARPLLWLNVGFYAVLWGLTVWRVVRYRSNFTADLLDHGRCVGFFTSVAATCVLGNQFVVVEPWPQTAQVLWAIGILLWAIITYGLFTILTVKADKPPLSQGINGGWLVAVVAAQAVATLGGLLTPQFTSGRDAVIFFSLVMWLGGGMLYIWIIALIFYRYTFFTLEPTQLAPPYWINMGAMAISALAGTVFVQNATNSPLLEGLRPFVLGLTLLFWATATWWIPLLLLLGAWRHLWRGVPLTYDVVYWSAVFPIGMYTACTHRLAEHVPQPGLDFIPKYLFWIALLAWAVTMLGMVDRGRRLLLAKK